MHDIATLKDKHVFFLGVNTGFVTDGLPDARFVDFYRERSSTHLHCAIVGNVAVPGGYGSNESTPVLSRDSCWRNVARAIEASGSLPGIQLATAWSGYQGQRKFVAQNSHQFIEQAQQLVQNLGVSSIEQILDGFVTGAAIAVDHGYRHVQIHAAHGYLPNLLVDDRINPNAGYIRDKFSELGHWLKSQSVESSIRCTMKSGNSEFDARGSDSNLDELIALPFDYVDLSSGFYNIDKRLIYPSRPDFVSARLAESLAVILRHPDRKFIASGKIMEQLTKLPQNASVGICRDLIANPSYLTQQTVGCRNHGKCHYHSRGERQITCSQWMDASKV